MLRMNRCPVSSLISPLEGHGLGDAPTNRLVQSPDLSLTMRKHSSLWVQMTVYLSAAHFNCSSGPFRLDFWFLLSFWPWIRSSFFLRSFCRFSFSSSSFCFILKCSLLWRCRCSLAFFIFSLCTVLRASSSARIWQGQNHWASKYSYSCSMPSF